MSQGREPTGPGARDAVSGVEGGTAPSLPTRGGLRAGISRAGVSWWRGVLLAACMLAPGAAPELAALEVALTSPPAGEPASGVVEVAAEVYGRDPIHRVELWVDGALVASLERPPWRARVDLGEANVEHHFRVVATDVLGGRAEDRVTSTRIAVQHEVTVDLQQLFVSVTDRLGRRVRGLVAEDFQITTEDGGRERITTFGAGELPASAVVLLDASASMEGAPLEAAVAGAQAFTARLREDDEAMVALFSDRILRATSFRRGGGALEELGNVRGAGGTAVADHLYFALNRLEPRLGRRVVILLSDGYDVSSTLDMAEVLWSARRSQAMVYWLRLEQGQGAARYYTSWRDADSNQGQYRLLEQLVSESGGRVIVIARLGEIDHAFTEVLAELRQQYVLGFHPQRRRHDGSWRPIRVRVRGAGLEARARGGYVD